MECFFGHPTLDSRYFSEIFNFLQPVSASCGVVGCPTAPVRCIMSTVAGQELGTTDFWLPGNHMGIKQNQLSAMAAQHVAVLLLLLSRSVP